MIEWECFQSRAPGLPLDCGALDRRRFQIRCRTRASERAIEMTTAAERTRALRWGRDLLIRLSSDQTIANELSRRAMEILDTYPTTHEIKDWIASDLPVLPHKAAAAIDAASKLFYQLPFSDRVDASYKRLLVDLQRHFPSSGSALDAARLGFFGGLREWLAE